MMISVSYWENRQPCSCILESINKWWNRKVSYMSASTTIYLPPGCSDITIVCSVFDNPVRPHSTCDTVSAPVVPTGTVGEEDVIVIRTGGSESRVTTVVTAYGHLGAM